MPVKGVRYNSLLWMCTLNTLTWPLTWPDLWGSSMSTNSLAAADITHFSSLRTYLYLHFKPQFCPYWILSRTEEPVKASTCAHDRRALQQLARNVHVKHSDLTWPDLWGSSIYSLAAADITHFSSLRTYLYLHFKPQFCPYWILSQTEELAKVGTCARDRRALQQLAVNVHVKHSDPTWPDPTESCPGQRNRRGPLPVTMTGVRYNSLLWMCTLNTLTRPDLTWPDPTESCPGQRN